MFIFKGIEATIFDQTVTQGTQSEAVQVYNLIGYSVQIDMEDVTPSSFDFAPSDVSVANDTITEVGHGLFDDLVVQVSSTGTLPGGLSSDTDYYVIVTDSDTFQLASSAGGSAIDLTSQGTGTHTLTPSGLSGARLNLEGSNNRESWAILSNTEMFYLKDDTLIFNMESQFYNYFRLRIYQDSGALSYTATFFGK